MNKETFNKKFGIYIAKKRRQADLSQSKLASLIGNNAQNISSIERGEVSPTLFWLTKLAKAFDISLTQLIEEFENSK